MGWLILLGVIVGGAVLAFREAPLWHWGVLALAAGLSSRVVPGVGVDLSLVWLVLALLPGVVLLALSVAGVRRAVLTGPARRAVGRILPRVSRTEQEALDAGTVGWDAELFSGRPDWRVLEAVPAAALSAEEEAFLEGPVAEVCGMIDDWDTRHVRADLSPEVWRFLKAEGFFGMLIGREHGGLGFSAEAQSRVVSRIASRSVAAGITVMVPNSLGPGELLERYGTEAQKGRYLHRLAKGLEVPCFALTGVHSGSDAGNMRDVGVVTRGTHEGREVLGVRLSWDKRYITLAPVATLIGLAFDLHDPEGFLGRGERVGITLALIPAGHKGVEIGRRHYPAGQAFMNGPTRGRDVFVPMDYLIGGAERAGQGWRMLMECLSTGRAISLPAIGSVSIKSALRASSAYARVRRQFGIPIGVMQGVAGPLAGMVKSAYGFEAARRLTAAMVDAGQRPAVISALLKYRTTEAMREAVDAALDIHGGRAIQDGPANYLFGGYMATPVAITVEGANILTRSLMTFAQGVLRAHPFLYAEIAAARDEDARRGAVAFDAAFSGHVRFMARNVVASFFHGLTLGQFVAAPAGHEMARWYRAVGRHAQAFALVADWMVVALGGALKREQALAGRMADILSELYLMSAALRRYEDEGRIAEDRGVVEAFLADRVAGIEARFGEVFDNFPDRGLALAMRVLAFPLGRRARGAADRENDALAGAVMRPGAFRDRMTVGVHVATAPDDPTGVLEEALMRVSAAEAVEARFLAAVKAGKVMRRLDRDAIADAVAAGVIGAEEGEVLRAAEAATDRALRVDDFARDALGARAAGRGSAAA